MDDGSTGTIFEDLNVTSSEYSVPLGLLDYDTTYKWAVRAYQYGFRFGSDGLFTTKSRPVACSGYIRDTDNSPISGVTVTFSNGGGSATTDSSGYYNKELASGWSGRITPSKTAWTFTPPFRDYTPGQLTQDYMGTHDPISISGYIKDSSGNGISGVTLNFNNAGGTSATGTSGEYSHQVPYGWSGTITPAKNGYTFVPPSLTYNTFPRF